MIERDRFEDAWREEYPLHGSTIFTRSGVNPDAYVNTRVQDGWLMWQACSAAHSAGARAYPTIDHWLTELAGEREIGHVIQEMTHMEVARQAWAAARAMTDSVEAQEPVLIMEAALTEICNWPDGGSRYGQGNIMRFAKERLDKARRARFNTHPQPMPQTDAARDAKRYQWLRAQHEMQDTFEDSEGFTVRSPAESAWTVFRPGQITSLEPVGCIPGELDEAIDAEIERLDRAKGE